VEEVSFPPEDFAALKPGKLSEGQLSDEELFFQQLWKEYFRSITIKERINLKLQRQHMPKRYWKYLTELQ
jgi:probable DNA metabolism protein